MSFSGVSGRNLITRNSKTVHREVNLIMELCAGVKCLESQSPHTEALGEVVKELLYSMQPFISAQLGRGIVPVNVQAKSRFEARIGMVLKKEKAKALEAKLEGMKTIVTKNNQHLDEDVVKEAEAKLKKFSQIIGKKRKSIDISDD